jgi:hypothetical protein
VVSGLEIVTAEDDRGPVTTAVSRFAALTDEL